MWCVAGELKVWCVAGELKGRGPMCNMQIVAMCL